jgi:hypothetical protein
MILPPQLVFPELAYLLPSCPRKPRPALSLGEEIVANDNKALGLIEQ